MDLESAGPSHHVESRLRSVECDGKVKSGAYRARGQSTGLRCPERAASIRHPMADPTPHHDNLLMKRVHRELIDDYDEELEMEREDWEHVAPGQPARPVEEDSSREARNLYFKELFRLQGELVKMHDWIVDSGHRLVILFEGRNAAGKGGAIKRITQRLNPRVARVAALPAPSSREKTQWYFQRYIAHLLAAGEMVLFDRS